MPSQKRFKSNCKIQLIKAQMKRMTDMEWKEKLILNGERMHDFFFLFYIFHVTKILAMLVIPRQSPAVTNSQSSAVIVFHGKLTLD